MPASGSTEACAIAYLNAAAEGLLGRKRQDVLGKSFADLFPEAGDSVLTSKLREALRERRALSFEANMGQERRKGPYAVRVLPHTSGVSIVCRRAQQPRGASLPGGEKP